MGFLNVKGVHIGEGEPKIIISLMGEEMSECLDDAVKGQLAGVDCFEFRGDFSKDIHSNELMVQHCQELRNALPANPLQFTFRSADQGGHATLCKEDYIALNRAVIADGSVDMIDIEVGWGDEDVSDLCAYARENGVVAVTSYHDFEKTPSTEELIDLMEHMLEIGSDLPKVAVMAHDAKDVLRVLEATEEVSTRHDGVPLQTMAMGRVGSISRLSGELFGSSLTFCSLEKSSAPGQVDVERARRIMDEFHAEFIYGK